MSRPVREGPNWPLLALGLAGGALAAYLSWTEWAGTSVSGCAVGSACDTVLSSRWATLFGLPTAFWGLLTYAALAATAFIARVDTHWRTAWLVSLFGLLYSAYLTTISLTVLESACPYCLTSLAIMTSIFALVTWQRPAELPGFSWSRWLTRTVPVAAAIIFVLHLDHTAERQPRGVEDPMARALAEHLVETGAVMYGARWCQHCQQQKDFFGASADRLPYVECSTGGPSSAQTARCQADRITSYPTWVIKGRRIVEVLTLQQLADSSGFQMPAATPAPPRGQP